MSAMDNLVQRMFESQLIEAKANGSRLPSVTSVAAGAGISRSSMYRYHSAVVARIQAPTRCRENDKREQLRLKVQLFGKQLTAERMLTRALARACAELAAEKGAMKDQFDDDKLSLQLRVEQLEHQIQGKKPLRLLRAR